MIEWSWNLDGHLRQFIHDHFPDKQLNGNDWGKTWKKNRFIQITTVLPSWYLHYEFIGGKMVFHIEGEYLKSEFKPFVDYLRKKTVDDQRLEWKRWDYVKGCEYTGQIDNYEELDNALKEMISIFDPLLEQAPQSLLSPISYEKYDREMHFKAPLREDCAVSLSKMTLSEIFNLNVTIPPYQRAYCWDKENVTELFNSILMTSEVEYHIGTVIFQRGQKEDYNNDVFNIIDGQQRLVTLTLLARRLGCNCQLPLLKQSFCSEDAINHVENTVYVIDQLVNHVDDLEELKTKLLNHITLYVLVLNGKDLDLAYTFFSNQNSKGVPLSDFDLLKAHHLRYLVSNEAQAEHLATRWNNLSSEEDGANEDKPLFHSLGVHLFRLRRWLRKKSDIDKSPRCIKNEYSAAPIINEIPPFGERFEFYEKIQGGAHFFAYAETFVNKYKEFAQLKSVKSLRDRLQYESHYRYADVIETLLFSYYIKFGLQYLPEALFCVTGIMAQHRYSSKRAIPDKIKEYAVNSEIVMMVDQASSPTFFLAEALASINMSGHDLAERKIQYRFYKASASLFYDIKGLFTDETIIKKMNNEYENE